MEYTMDQLNERTEKILEDTDEFLDLSRQHNTVLREMIHLNQNSREWEQLNTKRNEIAKQMITRSQQVHEAT